MLNEFLAILFSASLIAGTNTQTPTNPSTSTPSQVEISFGEDPLFTANAPLRVSMKSVKIKIQPKPPNYPFNARLQGVQGDVLVEVWVNESGVPTKSNAIFGPKEFDEISSKYALTWKFEPLILKDTPTPFRVRFVMPFRVVDGRPFLTIPKTFLW